MKRVLTAGGLFIIVLGLAYAAPAPAFAPDAPAFAGVSVLFVGDLMLDRNVARSAVAGGAEALFATSTRELFAAADLRVVNLEGTITTNPSIAQRNNKILRFTFEPALAKQVLALLNVSAASLANNHALDFGEFGYDDTRSYLEQWGVRSFGQPFNESHLSTVLEAKGKKICLVGYMELFDADTASVVQEIVRIKPACWRTVVVAHWGVEYSTTTSAAQRQEADAFIDAGADLVIGAHPHVVEPVEVYRGKAVFYSLGNFMFDQNFSVATTQGLAVRADFYEDKTTFTQVPLLIKDQLSSVAPEPVARFILP